MDESVRTIKLFIMTVVLMVPLFVVGGYYAVLYIVWDNDPHFIEADRCLDNGGVWEREISRCWYAGQCEDQGGSWDGANYRCVFDR